MKIPFMLSHDDWKGIKAKEIDQLGRRKFKNPEQEKQLEIFHIMDLRVEWACARLVVVNNLLLILCALLILINGTQVLGLIQTWLGK